MAARDVCEGILLGLLAILVLGLSLAEGKYVVEERSLSILSPGSLEGKYPVAVSSFGRPGYAGSLLGSLQYPKQGASGCTAFDKFQISFKKVDNDFMHAPIAVIESTGECDFAWRVYNAELAGAAAALILDTKDEDLMKMADSRYATPPSSAKYVGNITIPSALVNKTVGDKLRTELTTGGQINVKLEWGEAKVEPLPYEIWSISQDKCGEHCDAQVQFMLNFRAVAQMLEKGGYTVFTPHYMVWFCPPRYLDSRECLSQCLNNGRCSMKEGKYTKDCGNMVATSLGMNETDIIACMGDPTADEENPLLKAEQDVQANGGERGDIVITPTLVIKDKQYRGRLENGAVLKTMCALYPEGSEPSVCLGDDIQTNECLDNNGGCWVDSSGLITACRDTFKGRICECPYYQGVQFKGDGYQSCAPTGELRCSIQNAGCWYETRGNLSFSACSPRQPEGCQCPSGFTGDGVKSCEDIDECKTKTKCQCVDCSCTDTWGGYDCQCAGDLIYLADHDACVRKTFVEPKGVLWFGVGVVGLAVITLVIVGFIVYKYKVRTYMDARIRATMAQYMPLDSNSQDIYRHLEEEG
ncbi:hypothetical protein R1sor_001175 [Riccia sorocarpa]|uniref:EGF-like calcium-binding domain-containing protein n=1 Tax=Riccia sorocarpa TaxID=122646 RepID=A0ABD3GW40_9MARC